MPCSRAVLETGCHPPPPLPLPPPLLPPPPPPPHQVFGLGGAFQGTLVSFLPVLHHVLREELAPPLLPVTSELCCTWALGDPECVPTLSTLGCCGQTEDWHWSFVPGSLGSCPAVCIWRHPQVSGAPSPLSVPVVGSEQRSSSILPRTLSVRSELPPACSHSQWNVPFIPMSHCRQKPRSSWRGMKHLGAVSAEIITHPRS